MGKEFKKTGIVAVLVLSVLLECGGEARAPHLMGSVTVDGSEFGLGGASGTVLNMPRTIYWAGVAMPAFVQIELFGLDVRVDDMGLPSGEAFPSLTMMLAAGPDGNFYAGHAAIPASLEMQLGGIRNFVPESLLVNCSVRLSASPLDTSIVDVDLTFDFYKGDSHYQGSYVCPVCFPGVVDAAAAPPYPAMSLSDSLFFEVSGDTLRPNFFDAVLERRAGVDCYTVYAFTEPYAGSVPAKSRQTKLSFVIPVELADGEPVPTVVQAHVATPEDTLSCYAGYAFCWASGRIVGSVLEGSVLFQGNGSEAATRFFGGGRFSAPVK